MNLSFFLKFRYQLSLLLAAICYTTLVVSTAWLTDKNIDAFNQIFWRTLLGALFAGAYAFGISKHKVKINSKEISYMLISGLIFLGGFSTFCLAIYFGTPIAKAVALNYAYPLIVILLSYFLFGELPNLKHWIAVGISLISVCILIEVWTIDNLFEIKIGEILAFVNSFFYGAIIVFGKKIKNDTELSTSKSLFYGQLFMLPMFLIMSFIFSKLGVNALEPNLQISFPFDSWAVLITTSLTGGLLPLVFIYYGITKVKPYIASLLLLTEPIWVYICGLLVFNQVLSHWGIVGSLGIILSVFLI